MGYLEPTIDLLTTLLFQSFLQADQYVMLRDNKYFCRETCP